MVVLTAGQVVGVHEGDGDGRVGLVRRVVVVKLRDPIV